MVYFGSSFIPGSHLLNTWQQILLKFGVNLEIIQMTGIDWAIAITIGLFPICSFGIIQNMGCSKTLRL